MKFEVGDEVIVKLSNEEGKVVEILGDKMVMVDVRGVRFPAYTDQLDFPYFQRFMAQKKQEPKKPVKKWLEDIKPEKNPVRYQVAPGVWLLFFPVFNKDVFDDDIVESLRVHLVNQTQQGLHFHFWLKYGGQPEWELQNEIYGLQDFYLMNVPFENLNDGPSFEFEFSLISPDPERVPYFEAVFKPKAKQVFRQIEQIQQKGEAFFTHQLFEVYPEKPAEQPAESGGQPYAALSKAGFKVKPAKNRPADPAPPSVLDLHIEKLTDNHGNMSAAEKLELQLRSFEKWLDRLTLHYINHVWVIHGVGSGRLKDEVHEMLRHRHDVKGFVSQYHPWYGNGATEIFLK